MAASMASACQRMAPDAAIVPTATLTGTVVMPGQAVPVPFARVQALDASLKPIAGVAPTRTDAGGHFALDVPAGRPYILRFEIDNQAHPFDLLAVADPTVGDGAQLITVDEAMHVATELLLNRTEGLDTALQAIGAQDVQALVDAVRTTISAKPVDLASPASVSELTRQEAQNQDVQSVLSRVVQATDQASHSAVAGRMVQSGDTSVSIQTAATVDIAAVVTSSPTPAPPNTTPPPPPPRPSPTPNSRPDDRTAQHKAGPDRSSLEWAREFAWPVGPAVDPFEQAERRARVNLEPPVPRRRITGRTLGQHVAHPWPNLASPGQTRSKIPGPPPRAPVMHSAHGLPTNQATVRVSRGAARVAVSPHAALEPAPTRKPGLWGVVLAALIRWLPAFRWPTLAP